MKINRILASAVLSLSLGTGGTLAVAQASSAAQIVVAESQTQTLAPTPASAAAFTATPSAIGAFRIKADPQSRVTLTAKGQNTKAVTTNKAGLAQVKNLTPGVSYTLTTKIVNTTKQITAVPEGLVVAVNSLRVLTTEILGQLQLTWQHANTPAQGAVSFTVTAQPVNAPAEAIQGQTTSNEMVLTDLDLNSRFEFGVTATNTISSAAPTTALMARSLNDLQGKAVVTTPVTPVKQTTTPVAPPAPAPAPAPVTPSGPSTRTIYVCPDSFSEVSGLCEKTLPYTFANQSYTFHNETRTESCAGPDCPYSQYMDMGYSGAAPHCPNGGTLYGNTCMAWSTSSRQVTERVKDATPNGFTDTGSNWTKKDTLPAGYTDNGTKWVSMTAKVAREVSA